MAVDSGRALTAGGVIAGLGGLAGLDGRRVIRTGQVGAKAADKAFGLLEESINYPAAPGRA